MNLADVADAGTTVPGSGARRHLPELDGVRAFAAFGVIVEHYYTPGQFFFPGRLGVGVFFVLSGFLITRILLGCADDIAANRLTRSRALKQFYIRRFLRIFPLYYFYILLIAVVNPMNTRAPLPACAVFMANFYFVKHGFFWYVGHFWSLAVEEQFYLLWPLIMLVVPSRFISTVCMVTIVAGGVFKNLALVYSGNWIAAYVLLPSCMDTLAFGALLAVLSYTPAGLVKVRRWARHAWVPGLLILGACMLYKNDKHAEPAVLTTLSVSIWLISAFLIMHATGPGTDWVGRFLTWGPLRYLGTISYGIYVWHIAMPYPIYGIAKHLHFTPPAPGAAEFIEVSIFSVVFASVSWWTFERPINELKRFFPYRKPAAGVAAANG